MEQPQTGTNAQSMQRTWKSVDATTRFKRYSSMIGRRTESPVNFEPFF